MRADKHDGDDADGDEVSTCYFFLFSCVLKYVLVAEYVLDEYNCGMMSLRACIWR